MEDSSKVGRWTLQEHSKFLLALELFGKDWRKMSQYIGTRSNVQCRTHAQKHFKRVQSIKQQGKKKDPGVGGGHRKRRDDEEDTEEDSDKEELEKCNGLLRPFGVSVETPLKMASGQALRAGLDLAVNAFSQQDLPSQNMFFNSLTTNKPFGNPILNSGLLFNSQTMPSFGTSSSFPMWSIPPPQFGMKPGFGYMLAPTAMPPRY